MRHLGVLFLAPALLCAQAPVRGVLLERDAQPASGQFSVRLPTYEVLRFQFDAQTSVERVPGQPIDVARLKPGEKVDVVSDPIPGLVLRYARTVVVVPDPMAAPAPRPPALGRLRSANRYAEERALPTGNLTYAGVVSRMSGERIVLHTRNGREQALLLRKDTRYLLNGDLVDAATLKLNTMVFVRAGRDLWDQIEAYQVIWGKILAP